MSLLFRLNVKRMYIPIRNGIRRYSEMPDQNKPVKFTTSEAANWRAEFSRQGNIYSDSPDSQPIIISLSTAVFLFYFLYFREESDIDENFDMNKNIYSKVDGLEEVQLKVYRDSKLRDGGDVKDVDIRLMELEKDRLEKSHSSIYA